MKKILLFIVLAMLLVSCGKSEEKTSAKKNGQKVIEVKKETGHLVKLKYKFKKGSKFSYKLQTIANNIEEISADTTIRNEIIRDATYKLNFVVKDILEDQSAEIEVKINSIIAETKANGQSIKYDSKFIYSTRERIQFVDYEAVKKVPFLINVNRIGQVTKVHKIKKIIRNIIDIQKIPDTLSAATKEKMEFNIANGSLMPLIQQIFKVISEEKVGIDSSWQLKFTTPLAVFTAENIAIFKIENITFSPDTISTISSKLFMNVSGNNILTENGITYTFNQPLLDAVGSVKFNNTKGLVEFSESTTKLEMEMMMEGLDNNNKPLKSSKKDISNNTNVVELL